MWRYLPTRQGMCFATPDLRVYQDRLADPSKPIRAETITAKMSLAAIPPDLPVPRGELTGERAYRIVESYAEAYFANANETAGPAKLELSVRTETKYGRFDGGNFVLERKLPSVTMSIVRSIPNPLGGPLTIFAYPFQGPKVFDPRFVQLWHGAIVLLPTTPASFGVVQIHGPEIPLTLEYDLPGYENFGAIFPAPSAFDRLGVATAAVMSVFLDGGVITPE